jgi:hypothetical protein
MDKEEYLGDGLYASFDVHAIKLRAPREGGDHFVYLEPDVFRELERYVKKCWSRKLVSELPIKEG